MTCRVKAAGKLYICLQSPATPEGLDLPGKWTPLGKMETVIGDRLYPWAIYATDVDAGETLTVPVPDRWGAVLVAKKIDGLKAAAHARAAMPSDKSATKAMAPTDEWRQLAQDIANRKWFDRVASQAFDRQALILPADRDPLDVVLRRTAALLADLTSSARRAGPPGRGVGVEDAGQGGGRRVANRFGRAPQALRRRVQAPPADRLCQPAAGLRQAAVHQAARLRRALPHVRPVLRLQRQAGRRAVTC